MGSKPGALFKYLSENLGAPGIAAGIGAVVLAPLLAPSMAKIGKPIAKAAIKGGILAYEKAKVMMAETGEIFEDLVAEAKAELREQESDLILEETSSQSETH